ncbi:chemotaxis protein [Haloferax sp. Atlit-4N]|uniref:HAMP domain-containing sensor histidine kinase n=1 Tax=Haloferax sp. Atlit-4N TaxID=2077206 RepID=UPI000E24DEE1|nr:ATP-binding protein [Haloferax sp. Atlit-4N]RDZ51978.1 chemotaxis protein [Haloferax sp. Atlit-4N]
MTRRLLPRFVRKRYAVKFVLALGLVTLAIAAVGGYSYLHANEVIGEETRDGLVTNAEIQAQNLDEWLTRMEVQMRSISESAAFQSGDDRDINLYLWSVVERDRDIDAAYYIDTRNETVLTSTGSASVASAESVTTYYGRQEFTALAQQSHGDVVISDPFRPSEGAAPVLLFATTIPERPNRAVIAVANLRDISETHLHDINAGRFVVVDAAGTVVLAEDESRLLETDALETTRYDSASGFVPGQSLGDSKTEVGFARMEAHDWVVTSRVPTGEAYALRTDILTQILATLFVVGAGAALLAATIGRDTVDAVRTLGSSARELTDGNLDVAIDRDREDEFGDLYEAFDVMRVSLRDQILDAERAREEAESARREAWDEKEASERRRRHLERTAEAYGEVMRACADGDLAERIDPDEESEAMAEVARSFNEMMADVQERNEQLRTVSNVLSHDLRNPLNVAVGRAELLADETESDHVEPLVESLDRIDAIIDDALVLALQRRVEDTLPVALSDVARRSWTHVDTGDATLVVDENPRFAADPDLAAHVFENLFRNSVEHGSTGSRIPSDDAVEHGSTGNRTVSGDAVEHDSTGSRIPSDDAVEHGDDGVTVTVGALGDARGFYVEDDGPGIPESDRASVLEPGYTTNRAGGGTGFGLPIVLQVADAHGWDLTLCESASGGARFELSDVERVGRDTDDAASLV